MYLLVFTVLIVSMIGVYAQVLAGQAARLAAHQTGIAQAMMSWQSAAVSMGASIVNTNMTNPAGSGAGATATDFAHVPPASGCSLTNPASAGLPKCPGPINLGLPIDATDLTKGCANAPGVGAPVNTSLMGMGTITSAAGTPYDIYDHRICAQEVVRLPKGFAMTVYSFNSILYQDTSGNSYVITYLPPVAVSGTNPGGFLSLANGNQIGLTAGNLVQQLQHTGIPQYSYGGVTGGVLMATGVQYTVPKNAAGAPVIPDGSVAIISATAGL